MASGKRRGLGKGLDALIPQTPQSSGESAGLKQVSVQAIESNPRQPRSHFDEEKLAELSDSIREVGLIQPLVVQQLPTALGHAPRYQLIAGERRWRAAKLAGIAQIDVVIKDASPQEMLELALIENIQRDDLNPLEEALAYQQLASEFSLTQERIAARVGRSRASVANTMRLLRLPEDIQGSLASGAISEGHARALLGLMRPTSSSWRSRQWFGGAIQCGKPRSWCVASQQLSARCPGLAAAPPKLKR